MIVLPRRGRALLVALLAASLAGCGSGATPSPTAAPSMAATPSPSLSQTATAAPSATTGAAASAGASLAMKVTLPAGWQQVELTDAAIRNQIDAAGSTNPTITALLTQLLASGQFKTIKLYALGFDGTTPIGSMVGTTIEVGQLNLDGVSPTLEAGFKQLGGVDVTLSRQTLPVGDTLVIDLKLPLSTGSSTITVQDRIFNTIRDGYLYQLTFTCFPAGTGACFAAADSTAKSLTLAP